MTFTGPPFILAFNDLTGKSNSASVAIEDMASPLAPESRSAALRVPSEGNIAAPAVSNPMLFRNSFLSMIS